MPDAISDLKGRSDTISDLQIPRGVVALHLIEKWRRAGAGGLLYIAGNERQAEHLGANIYSLFPNCPVMVLPRWNSLPYDAAGPSREIMGRRASVLRRLAACSPRPLVIATPEAALQRVPPREVWRAAALIIRTGAPFSAEDLRYFLERTGYELCAVVDEPGQAAIHGHTLDIFPAGALGPVRIELTEGRITELHSYDPATQRTNGPLSELILDAASEIVPNIPSETPYSFGNSWLCDHYSTLETLADYMPTAFLFVEPGVNDRVVAWLDQIQEGYESWNRLLRAGATNSEAAAAPAPERLYVDQAEWESWLRRGAAESLHFKSYAPIPVFATEPNPTRGYRSFIAQQLVDGRQVVLAAADPRDLKIMSRRGAPALANRVSCVADWPAVLDASANQTIGIEVDFEAGFLLHKQNVAVIAAPDLLGSRARHRNPMAVSAEHDALGGEGLLRIGEAVVHLDHGIGLLRGIELVSGTAGIPDQETLRLEYAGGASLMVPIQEISSVWGYGSASVSLDRLGSDSWTARRTEIMQEIDEAANAVVRHVRTRERQDAPKLVPPPREYERFAAGFPFLLTADQTQSVEDVLSDLGSGQPMDRLLCGDVGFGKTEVALRAAAAAVLSGKQVAVIVPTTVLARQHLGTFWRRFTAFGIKIELLSRLVKPAEARRVKQGLRDGTIRIVIGTHAVAAKDVRFKELALLIIDEEQRFGARIKEKLRSFGQGLHVLAMSATPIPRTLQRAITGLQSLSTLETPPARRLPVRTVLTPFEPALVRDVLSYERRRGGQSFFVCPRIEDLAPIAKHLREIAPELRFTMAHGQLPPAEVDEAVVSFAEGRGEILLTTNIIETGLDIPRANTILVWRPDRFGTAQLHQLRGRVGRGRRRGLAYLLTEPEAELPVATEKRLRALTELDRLGAGFEVSRRDLDLRGAGDLLGEAQAGHIRQIGFELYRHLLDRALLQAQTGKVESEATITLRLGVPASIPADYVSDPEVRINLYARLARLRQPTQIDEFADEIEDRFGPPPPATRNLIDLARIADRARRVGIVHIDAGPVGIAITFSPEAADAARRPVARFGNVHWAGDRAVLERPHDTAERVSLATELLEELPVRKEAADQ